MIAKYWKKLGLLILIVCCLYNITVKIVRRTPMKQELIQTVEYVVNEEKK